MSTIIQYILALMTLALAVPLGILLKNAKGGAETGEEIFWAYFFMRFILCINSSVFKYRNNFEDFGYCSAFIYCDCELYLI